jgi:hypothetical protein
MMVEWRFCGAVHSAGILAWVLLETRRLVSGKHGMHVCVLSWRKQICRKVMTWCGALRFCSFYFEVETKVRGNVWHFWILLRMSKHHIGPCSTPYSDSKKRNHQFHFGDDLVQASKWSRGVLESLLIIQPRPFSNPESLESLPHILRVLHAVKAFKTLKHIENCLSIVI